MNSGKLKVSDLINKLQIFLANNGDLEVYVFDHEITEYVPIYEVDLHSIIPVDSQLVCEIPACIISYE
jgi:hypothetical protein